MIGYTFRTASFLAAIVFFAVPARAVPYKAILFTANWVSQLVRERCLGAQIKSGWGGVSPISFCYMRSCVTATYASLIKYLNPTGFTNSYATDIFDTTPSRLRLGFSHRRRSGFFMEWHSG